MEHSIKSRTLDGVTKRTWQLGLALVALVAVPGQALAQAYICDSGITMNALGDEPFFINEPIPIELTLSADVVNDGVQPVPNDGSLHILSFDYKPDCSAGQDFFSCTSAGNTVVPVTAAADIGGTCNADFSVQQVDAETLRFTPASPIVLTPADPNSCTVEFEIMVAGAAEGTTTIYETSGWAESQIECYEPNGTPYPDLAKSSATGELSFVLSTERGEFRVTKNFVDDSAEEVEVFIRCNAGLPLEQSFMLGDEEHVSFVVKDYPAGQMDCHVWEEPVPAGYTPNYVAAANGGSAASVTADANGCYFEGVESGGFTCDVTNTLGEVVITVNKEWIGVEDDSVVSLDAEASYTCHNVYTSPNGGDAPINVQGTLTFSGLVDSDVIDGIYPAPTGSYCEVTEVNVPMIVEDDSSDCANIPVVTGAECTIYNTVFFEGIPTLSQYGLALMALLMLGVGMVGFRRFA